jgi:uncharacterized protein
MDMMFKSMNANLFSGTAWCFSREVCDEKLDYIFVDEAGQVSIAYLVAMAHKANNVVVMGDQMQLPQPVQGTHPGESSLSILDYQLQDQVTVPVDQGVFLNRSYRMHKSVNQFISEMVYESRLDNDPQCDQQAIHFAEGHNPALDKSSGITAISIKHSGNKQSSQEEVELIRELALLIYLKAKKRLWSLFQCQPVWLSDPLEEQTFYSASIG